MEHLKLVNVANVLKDKSLLFLSKTIDLFHKGFDYLDRNLLVLVKLFFAVGLLSASALVFWYTTSVDEAGLTVQLYIVSLGFFTLGASLFRQLGSTLMSQIEKARH